MDGPDEGRRRCQRRRERESSAGGAGRAGEGMGGAGGGQQPDGVGMEGGRAGLEQSAEFAGSVREDERSQWE